MTRLEAFDRSKRAFDVVVSAIALVLLAPVMVIIGALVVTQLGRPVLFSQARPGRGGKVFQLLKFRTMLTIDEGRGLVTNAQRMTPVGGWLRSWSLDELPSLWNVLRGEMSIVGPRPLLVEYLPLYTPTQARRHEVRPGLTGLAQVNGRNSLDWESRFAFDVDYIERRSWSLDLLILARTVRKVLQRDGISSDGHVVGAPLAGVRQEEGKGL